MMNGGMAQPVALIPSITGSGISAGLGLISSLISGLALEDKKDDRAVIISAGLADIFKSASIRLEDTLRIAIRGGRNEDKYNSIPAPKWDTYQTKIAKLFNGGWFLLDDDIETVRASKLYLIADKLSDVYEKMASYGLNDRETYYKSLIDCALNKGDKDNVDTSSLVLGEIPRYLFNLPALFVEYDSSYGCGSPFDSNNCDYRKCTPLK
ncbi:hypothetical protein FAUST_11477 [Fusarium austroamericanum]|uniref:Uncharacterized protein n=1 Tax=Fusarium austroamericanum TaxID=282268 RepID=A0AAN6BV36_FUSAU|nr:hypothetical protein FAUST_11477 [Fusarium austroamericanum]